MTLIIRPLRQGDIQPATQSGLAAWVSTIAPVLTDFNASDLLRIEDAFRQFLQANLLRSDDDHLMIGDLGGQIVGFYNLERDNGQLTDLWIAPQWQGQGIATAMMHDAKCAAMSLGQAELCLEVIVQNGRAMRFYRKEGFAEYGRKMVLDPILGRTVEKSLMRVCFSKEQ